MVILVREMAVTITSTPSSSSSPQNQGWSHADSHTPWPSLTYNEQKQGWSQAGYTSSTTSSPVDRQARQGWSQACSSKTSAREFDWSAYRQASSFTLVDWDHEVDQVLLEEFHSLAGDASQRQGFIADIRVQLQKERQGLKREVRGGHGSRSWPPCFNPGESQRVPPRGPPGL